MIVVRIELWPFGDSRRLLALEELTIVNVGTLEGSRCRYEARLGDEVALLVHDREHGPVQLARAALTLLGRGSVAAAATTTARRASARARAGQPGPLP